MVSQEVGEDRSRLPGRGTVGKLGEEEEAATEQRREYIDFELDLDKKEKSMLRAMPQPWHWP